MDVIVFTELQHGFTNDQQTPFFSFRLSGKPWNWSLTTGHFRMLRNSWYHRTSSWPGCPGQIELYQPALEYSPTGWQCPEIPCSSLRIGGQGPPILHGVLKLWSCAWFKWQKVLTVLKINDQQSDQETVLETLWRAEAWNGVFCHFLMCSKRGKNVINVFGGFR